jgi:hypothetical protein
MSQTARNLAANTNETDAGQPANKKPGANFRLASVEASVWSNASDKGEFYNITFQPATRTKTSNGRPRTATVRPTRSP